MIPIGTRARLHIAYAPSALDASVAASRSPIRRRIVLLELVALHDLVPATLHLPFREADSELRGIRALLRVSPALLELALHDWLLWGLVLADQNAPELEAVAGACELGLRHAEPVADRLLDGRVDHPADLADAEARRLDEGLPQV